MSRPLTKKQRGFSKDYMETGNATLAVKRNYRVKNDASARSIGSQNLAKLNIQQTIQEALEAAGVTNAHISAKVAELINTPKRLLWVKNGEAELVQEQMDVPAVKAGLEFALHIKKRELDGGGQSNGSVLTEEEKEEIDAIFEQNIKLRR